MERILLERESASELELLRKAKAIPLKRFDPIADINLFSILGMENKEVSAHSAFLYYVFNPFYRENGTVDDDNLMLLYQMLKNKNPAVQYPQKPDTIQLYKEVSFSYGRLDFLIVYSDEAGEKENAIIVELKIWAGEQPNQIERYREYLREKGYNENNIFFLTPSERSSVTGESINITLKDDIFHVLQKICEGRRDHISYVTIIKQYIDVITKLTGDKEMSNNIINSPADIIALDNLFNYRIEALTNMLFSFLASVKNGFEARLRKAYPRAFESGAVSFLDYRDNIEYINAYYKNGSSCHPAIIVKLKKEWLRQELIDGLDGNSPQDYYPCFYIEIENTLYAGFTMKRGDENPIYCDISPIQELLRDCCKADSSTKWFMDWNWVYVNGCKIDFKNYNDPKQGVFRLMDGNSFTVPDVIISQIVDNGLSIFEKMLPKFFNINISGCHEKAGGQQ